MARIISTLLFLTLILFDVSAHAGIIGYFEGPVSGPVSGIGIIRGWVFSDKAGISPQIVDFFLDGKPWMTIPCCGERGDVRAAYPQYPAENTFKSSFGLTINWGEVSAYPHTVQIVVTMTDNEQWQSDVRTVIVVKLAGSGFLSNYDLSQAAVWIDYSTQEVVFDNVFVVDRATGERMKIDGIRQKWRSETQNPQIVGPQANAVKFKFGIEVSTMDQKIIKDITHATMEYMQQNRIFTTRPLIVFAMNQENLLDTFLIYFSIPTHEREWWRGQVQNASALKDAVFVCTSCSAWLTAPPDQRAGGLGHEISHILIQSQWFDWNHLTVAEYVEKIGPAWLLEGAANLTGYHVSALFGGVTVQQNINFLRSFTVGSGNNLAAMETYNGLYSADNGINVANIATYDLFGGNLLKLASFWQAVANGANWKTAFQNITGRSIEDFYTTYIV